jgi:hypothetical protein
MPRGSPDVKQKKQSPYILVDIQFCKKKKKKKNLVIFIEK